MGDFRPRGSAEKSIACGTWRHADSQGTIKHSRPERCGIGIVLPACEGASPLGARSLLLICFYRKVTEGHFANDTVPRAVDSALTCILGREAAARGTRLTMEQVVAESKTWK